MAWVRLARRAASARVLLVAALPLLGEAAARARRAAVVGSTGWPTALPGPLGDLSEPPSTIPRWSYALSLVKELERVDLAGGISEEQARRAYENLYGNWTLTNFKLREKYITGIRVQIINKKIYFKPVPPEVLSLQESLPDLYAETWSVPAAHILAFLTRTLERHDVPDVDFTVAIGDFCLDITRTHHEAWGLMKDPDPRIDGVSAREVPKAESDVLQTPLFHWNTAKNGRKACNVITTPTYDWHWSWSNFSDGNFWRLENHTGNKAGPPPWVQRSPTLIWRGSLIGEDGIRARALRLSLIHPKLLDVKVVEGGIDCQKYVGLLSAFPDHAGLSDCMNSVGAFVGMAQQLNHRYTLDMDGGGPTWRFKNSLLAGFVVFKVDSGNEQWFQSALQPFVHYVPVDRENFEADLMQKIRWANSHPEDVERISAAAMQFAKEHLNDDNAHWQQHAALTMYSSKQRFKVRQDEDMRRFCCADAANTVQPGEGPMWWIGAGRECRAIGEDDQECARPPRQQLWGAPSSPPPATPPPEWINDPTLAPPTFSNKAIQAMLDDWNGLTNVLAPFGGVKDEVVTQNTLLTQQYHDMSTAIFVKNICEVGFNAGHSAMLFLLSNPKAKVYSFGLDDHSYTQAAVSFLEKKFPGRLVFVPGDSAITLPAFASAHPDIKCQILSVDGGNTAAAVGLDIRNFRPLSDPHNSVLIVNNSPCTEPQCQGPGEAWREATTSKEVLQTVVTPIDTGHGTSCGVYNSEWVAPATRAPSVSFLAPF